MGIVDGDFELSQTQQLGEVFRQWGMLEVSAHYVPRLIGQLVANCRL